MADINKWVIIYTLLLVIIVLITMGAYVIINSRDKPKKTKPIIRHCANCKWDKNFYCSVKYKDVKKRRISALLCRHYCKKEGADNG